MKPDDSILQTIAQRIRTVIDPEQIILYGSAASDTMTADSDIDLLIIHSGYTGHRAENSRIRSALGDLEIPVDIFMMTPERFAETKDIFGGIAWPANKYGKVIYAG
ncbi:MAG: nucleotidyltransferase domain-containing protein [Desulfatirhabdiaceae bacterium]